LIIAISCKVEPVGLPDGKHYFFNFKYFSSNETGIKFNAPTLQRNRLICVLLAVLFATTFSIAQGTDQPPYNPCAASHTLAAHCLDGSRTCNYYSQFACSEGYCWALGVPGNNAGIPPNGLGVTPL